MGKASEHLTHSALAALGPLDAAGWHALSATHLGIHRAQIERIWDGLRPNA